MSNIKAWLNVLERNVQQCESDLQNAQDTLDTFIENTVKKDFPNVGQVTHSWWECPDPNDKTPYLDPNKPNPIGFCVYDIENDPCEDSCLYCGNPYERK